MFISIRSLDPGDSDVRSPGPIPLPFYPEHIMLAPRLSLFLACVAFLSLSAFGQEPKAKKAPTEDEATTTKYRGQLPFYWKELGLTDEQRQKVYKINSDYNDQIESLELKIKDLKSKRDKERFEVLSAEQKKRLEAIIRSKIGG